MLNRGLTVLVCLVLGLTVLDIAVVETVYRPTGNWSNIYVYHMVYWVLIAVLPLVGAYKTQSLAPLLTYVLFFFGVEDTLFYGLQGYLPSIYWGVNVATLWQPTVSTVLVLNVVGVSVCVVLLFLYQQFLNAKQTMKVVW